MNWIFAKQQSHNDSCTLADFNSTLPENDGDGSVCVAEPRVKTRVEGGQNLADDDIRNDRVRSFDSPEDLIKSLKQPW